VEWQLESSTIRCAGLSFITPSHFELATSPPAELASIETKANYNYFRDYDPSIGRYVESDPIGLMGGYNTYAFAASSPLSFIDPDGLSPAIPDPNGVVPGGPWKPNDANRPGNFLGPGGANGGRSQCQWVPAEGEGGPPGSGGYWKVNPPGQSGWQRYNQRGDPISVEEAHRIPRPRPFPNPGPGAVGIGGMGGAAIAAGILGIITPGNIMQCKNSCDCGDLCKRPGTSK